ncbi:axonemal dynein gamma heavy chain, putative [Perkinsus marinus ATCC 50983]|uniref:Axonemal dynein gamma heavy chain, putative n=1 Tax=Perkinsus marinus (strain ATCC 50983 / TXsc) TaxID=423536 RepID=C5KK31_PERM5|nr:axonemal dynein gamma heavy chain, putative [Perkinsus marinus ATCC 50983]EER14943.1 axonemal dynein gamma heavy chain, putative [Perkinsus marinus ATCC 50983]|eukprot:XP_002783147.1 axonemal dynein gamma heavy chain, putative [Perkinsus marinus ATCC 50983]
MVDPQGQALRWIKSRESDRVAKAPGQCVSTLSNPRLKDQLEFTMGEGLCLILENVEEEIDPILDPVLEKAIVKKGKNLYINVSDQNMDYNPAFVLYMTSRLPNPHFSPELSAKCTVIDFTVTLKGLEQQLLGRVLGMEQKSLEDSLAALMEEVTNNTKSLQLLDKQLLERLSNSSGNLLDDIELIEVLANTKAKAKEVEQKLMDAEEKKIEINQKREQYRSVATRGSVMYFCVTDMTLVSNPITLQPTGWMYNCSLIQFLEQFDISVKNSEKCQPTMKRVDKIIDYLTYQIYRYMNRGLFERDKMMFKLMVTMKIMVVAGRLTQGDVGLFLKGGSDLDVKSERSNPNRWMVDKVWLNVLQLSRHSFGKEQLLFFRELPDFISRNEAAWRVWYDENEPERCPVPDYEERLNMDRNIGFFLRMCLVRCIREDRTTIAAAQFINKQLDPKYTAPVTDSIDSIYCESQNRKPVLYLLSAGSDPTSMIDDIAKKKKKFPTDKVSMGEGQEVIAWEKMKNGFLAGTWVILQNCHLGLGFMNQMEDILTRTPEIAEDFRLWITCEITNLFPIGLLQMAIKVTLEPPMGLQAGLSRTYTTMVSQELLDKIDHEKWRCLVYVMSFMHSVVQERRKFGPIGWCVPYEFNNSDLEASLLFLEKHLSTTVSVGQPLSWTTTQYMVAEVQYGGRITDDLDRELFNTYAAKWFCDEVFQKTFSFNNYPSDHEYTIPEGLEIQQYREHIDKVPAVDSPLIFGLHTNADLTYRQLEASMMLTTIQETLPKEGGGGSGKSRDEIVKDKANEVLSKVPPDFVEEIFRSQITKLKGPPNTPDKGFAAPLNIFLFQELQRIQRVIGIVRNNLQSLVMAIEGTVVMTPDLLEDLNMIFDARLPRRWTHDPSGAEISWLMPTLGAWFTGLLDRVNQLGTWLESGRGAMKGYWLTGFLNAQGFLTGMRQEVTRQHKKDQWALDDVVTHTEVLSYDLERVKDVPDEGQNIYGLFIEGARWNRQDGRLDESEPKKLFTTMPAIYVTAVTMKDRKARGGEYGPYGPYDCAVYKYPKRNDRYLLFRLNLKTDVHPSHWKLRGVCLLCATE